MTIPLHFLTRYAIPLIVAAIYIRDSDITEQISIFTKTERLADAALASARKEGEGVETFDYIIVGAGPAGSILANRLSVSGQFSVLLLEAGGDPNPVRDIPFAAGLVRGLANDYLPYTTVKQEHACLASDGICPFGMGRAVGGGSSINAGVYNRGKPKDYDNWANFTGDPSWSWQNIKGTFNSFEDYHGYYEDTAGDRHGYGGEMYVGIIDYNPGQAVVEEAIREKGFPVGDLDGGEEFTYGFSKFEYNIKNGLRWGTYHAFLEPILDRPNLFIYRHAFATKIETALLPDQTYQAVGVTYERHGFVRTATAAKEVIISCGAVGSPALLMWSGIGPKEHLEDVGISPIIDLPVGQYLQDHAGYILSGGDGGFLVNTSFGADPHTRENVLQYIENGTGPLATQMGALDPAMGTGSALMKGYLTSSGNDDRTWPELAFRILQLYNASEDRQEFSAYVEIARTSHSGEITLPSSDPHEQPQIDPRILADLEDVEKLLEGIEVIRDIFLNSQTFLRIGVQPIQGNYEPCEGQQGRDYWRCMISHKGKTLNHPTSTCRMGPNSSVAVLDSKLKVFGTANLRVVDASSMPFLPSGNTNLPAMLMGARGAEIILNN